MCLYSGEVEKMHKDVTNQHFFFQNSDFVPNTDTVISGLYLARKLNEFSVAVRWLESVRVSHNYHSW